MHKKLLVVHLANKYEYINTLERIYSFHLSAICLLAAYRVTETLLRYPNFSAYITELSTPPTGGCSPPKTF